MLNPHFAIVEIAGGATAALAVVGYVSQRSRANYLGIAGIDDVPIEHYLYEAYLFFAAAFTILLLLSLIVVPIVLVSMWVGRSQHLCAWIERNPRITLALQASVLPFVSILTVLSFFLFFLPEDASHVLLRPLAEIPSGRVEHTGTIAVIACLLLAISGMMSRTVAGSSLKVFGAERILILRAFGWLGCFMLLWCAIVKFNANERDLNFPTALLLDRNDKTILCGLLLLTTKDEYVLWSPPTLQETSGKIAIFQHAEGMQLEVGQTASVADFVRGLYQPGNCAHGVIGK